MHELNKQVYEASNQSQGLRSVGMDGEWMNRGGVALYSPQVYDCCGEKEQQGVWFD